MMISPRLSFPLLLSLCVLLFTSTNAQGDPQDRLNDALIKAVRAEDGEAIRDALRDGADLNFQLEGSLQTPLVHAILTGKFSVVEMLFELGADSRIVEKDGYDILHAAAFQGRAMILDYLLWQEGMRDRMANDQHEDGYYPFHRACWGMEERHTQTLKVFLTTGRVDPRLKAANGKMCLDMCQNEGSRALLAEYLFPQESKDEGDDDGDEKSEL